MTMNAKYPSTCPTCRGRITPGQSIEWSKGTPARHSSCGGSTATKAPATRPYRAGKWTGCSCGSREDSNGALIRSNRNCSQCRFDGDDF